jgi:hypothetical protein
MIKSIKINFMTFDLEYEIKITRKKNKKNHKAQCLII